MLVFIYRGHFFFKWGLFDPVAPPKFFSRPVTAFWSTAHTWTVESFCVRLYWPSFVSPKLLRSFPSSILIGPNLQFPPSDWPTVHPNLPLPESEPSSSDFSQFSSHSRFPPHRPVRRAAAPNIPLDTLKPHDSCDGPTGTPVSTPNDWRIFIFSFSTFRFPDMEIPL